MPYAHQIGGAHHDAEIHLVHVKEGTDDELLVIGVLLDASEYGTNVVVRVYCMMLSFVSSKASVSGSLRGAKVQSQSLMSVV